MQSLVPNGFRISLAWSGFNKNDKTLETFIKLMSAKKFDEFKATMPLTNSFNLILVVADETEIHSIFLGNAPKRAKKNETKGLVITPGWKVFNQWLPELEEEDKLVTISNKNGVILNTNNSFLEEGYQNHISFNWGDEQRLLRATKMLNNRVS